MNTVQRAIAPARKPVTGLRKITPAMIAPLEKSMSFELTETRKPGQVLAAFKAAAPHLGLGAAIVHAVDYLFALTHPIDWQPGARPIVWPSAATQEGALCLSRSQVKRLNRRLVELGLVVMKDSPNGKRYGRRAGTNGPIIEAYGFDLSPLADRQSEFEQIAKAGREARLQLTQLRRQFSITRNALRQLELAASDQALSNVDWERIWTAAGDLDIRRRPSLTARDSEAAVAALQALEAEVRRQVAEAIGAAAHSAVDKSVDKGPLGHIDEPHITTTNQLFNPRDTVVAPQKETDDVSPNSPSPAVTETSIHPTGAHRDDARTETDATSSAQPLTFTISPAEIARLAPRLRTYLPSKATRWPEIVDAADWLRDEMGISRQAWGDACLTMGREQAAITVAIVSAKSPDHFRSSPGAYFHGMISKAKSGNLELGRTIWAMRNRYNSADTAYRLDPSRWQT